jgi:hypothetical protein
MKNEKKLKCGNCGYEGPAEEMYEGFEPYALEIFEEEIEVILCDDCYFESCEDI